MKLNVANSCSDTKHPVMRALRLHVYTKYYIQMEICMFPQESLSGSTIVKAITFNAQELPESLHFVFFLNFFSGSGDLSCREMLSLVALVMSCYSSMALHDVTDAVSCVTSQ